MLTKSIKVKRPVKVKTVVTEGFKEQAKDEINKEIRLLDNQIMQLEVQSKQIQDQVSGGMSQYFSEGSSDQAHMAIEELLQRLQQMSELKQELQFQKENIDHLALNNVIVTGSLENYVEIKPGENLYEKFKEAEIIIKDGVVQDIID